LAEIRRGIELLSPGKRRDQLEQWLESDLLKSFDNANVLSVTKAIGDGWAVLSARAQQKGFQPSVIDGLVAATALEHNLTLLRRNVKDFDQLGVPLLNPWDSASGYSIDSCPGVEHSLAHPIKRTALQTFITSSATVALNPGSNPDSRTSVP
jgi:toxin FitB